MKDKPYVLVTTEHRGVFAGYLERDDAPASVTLNQARCAIRFGTTKGFLELARTGPTSNSRIGSPAESVRLFKVTSIAVISDEAIEKWLTA